MISLPELIPQTLKFLEIVTSKTVTSLGHIPEVNSKGTEAPLQEALALLSTIHEKIPSALPIATAVLNDVVSQAPQHIQHAVRIMAATISSHSKLEYHAPTPEIRGGDTVVVVNAPAVTAVADTIQSLAAHPVELSVALPVLERVVSTRPILLETSSKLIGHTALAEPLALNFIAVTLPAIMGLPEPAAKAALGLMVAIVAGQSGSDAPVLIPKPTMMSLKIESKMTINPHVAPMSDTGISRETLPLARAQGFQLQGQPSVVTQPSVLFQKPVLPRQLNVVNLVSDTRSPISTVTIQPFTLDQLPVVAPSLSPTHSAVRPSLAHVAETLSILVKQAPNQVESVSHLMTMVTQKVPDAAPSLINTIRQIATQSPVLLREVIPLLSGTATRHPVALNSLSTITTALASIPPKEASKSVVVLSSMAAAQPRAFQAVTRSLATIAQSVPLQLHHVIQSMDRISTKAPDTVPAVNAAIMEVMRSVPQAFEKCVAVLSTIADKMPSALKPVVVMMVDIAQRAPHSLELALHVLDLIATMHPHQIGTIVTALGGLARVQPQLLGQVLSALQNFLTQSPQLLAKFIQVLNMIRSNTFDHIPPETMGRIMQLLATATTESASALLDRLIKLGQIDLSETSLVNEYAIGEIKKNRRRKILNSETAALSSTEELIRLFDHLEMENWKLAAQFRKQLNRKGAGTVHRV
jgi:hypothetical protein